MRIYFYSYNQILSICLFTLGIIIKNILLSVLPINGGNRSVYIALVKIVDL